MLGDIEVKKFQHETLYNGTVKRHYVCKCHVAIDIGVKQSEDTIFLQVISMGLKLWLFSFLCILEETISQEPIFWSRL